MEEMDAKKKFVTDEKKKYVKLHIFRECVRAGAGTRRSLGYHLLHPLILKLLVLCAPADFEDQSSLL